MLRFPNKPFPFGSSVAAAPTFVQSFSASMASFAGALPLTPGKALAAGMATFSGSVVRSTTNVFMAGMASFAGTTAKETSVPLSGSMSTFAGSLIRTAGKTLTASMASFAGALSAIRAHAISFAASMASFAGALAKQTGVPLPASMASFAGNTVPTAGKNFAAGMSNFAGTITVPFVDPLLFLWRLFPPSILVDLVGNDFFSDARRQRIANLLLFRQQEFYSNWVNNFAGRTPPIPADPITGMINVRSAESPEFAYFITHGTPEG